MSMLWLSALFILCEQRSRDFPQSLRRLVSHLFESSRTSRSILFTLLFFNHISSSTRGNRTRFSENSRTIEWKTNVNLRTNFGHLEKFIEDQTRFGWTEWITRHCFQTSTRFSRRQFTETNRTERWWGWWWTDLSRNDSNSNSWSFRGLAADLLFSLFEIDCFHNEWNRSWTSLLYSRKSKPLAQHRVMQPKRNDRSFVDDKV